MSSVADLWRAVDPDAVLLSGPGSAVGRPVRGVQRTRAAPPHLPPLLDGQLLVTDMGAVGTLDELLAALRRAELSPVAILLSTVDRRLPRPLEESPVVLASELPVAQLAERAAAYLADEPAWLASLAIDLRLACAEAALASPEPATPAGIVAGRLRRGIAISADGRLLTLHPRPAGRALAARFAALHSRLLADAGSRSAASRQSRDGLWLLERAIRPGASAWLFDDAPPAAVDTVALEALSLTLRALLRRPPDTDRARTAPPGPRAPADEDGDPLAVTLLAVARHNGRVSPAARALGVHRNTVLYRLRRARAERDLDPRRPQDALRILGEADRGRR